MVADQHKWWRWIGEESLSGGIIGLWEGGNTFPCGVRRPSQHSMMRWLGNYFDQVGREHMTYRITGRRNANAMSLLHTPVGEVGPTDVLWVETQHPKFHELTVTWQVNGEVVPGTGNSRNLELADLDVARRRRRPGDGQGRDGLGPRSRLQGRAAHDADAAVDGRRAARAVLAGACVHDLDADRSRGRRRRGRLRRDHASDRRSPRRHVAAQRGRRPERQPAQLRPRCAGAPAWDAFAQRHGRHADRRRGPWTTRCPRRRGRCRRR